MHQYSDLSFVQIYRDLKAKQHYKEKTEADWDNMAPRFHQNHHDGSPYIDRFLSYLNYEGVSSILDFGCGSGTLSIPLAEKGYDVTAADFSSGMLTILQQEAEKAGCVDKIQSCQIAWEDNWDRLEQSDLVIASRCSNGVDFPSVVEKLVSKANLRVALTWLKSPGYINPRILEAIGRDWTPWPDWIHGMNILYEMGYDPEVKFIPYGKGYNTSEKEEFLHTIEWKIGQLNDEEKELAVAYYHDKVLKEPERYDHQGFSWAFISWEAKKRNF
jgi:SAM-dependent methyltransferase